MSCWAVVVAAGRGVRFGAPGNKVYEALLGRSVLSRAMEALEGSGCFAGIALVHTPGEEDLARQAATAIALPVRLVCGGGTRQESVLLGLRALPEDAEIAAVHDGARPIVSGDTIRSCVASAREKGSGVAASPARETIKRAGEGGLVLETLNREQLWAMKTPQCFAMPELLACYEQAFSQGIAATDDAQVMELCGRPVYLVPCGEENIKITAPQDIRVAEALLGGGEMPRVGFGYDVHALAPDRELILCGVKIPHERGLAGHSDADVATHALIDALLGACAMGDIGQMFPDSDERYLGADSLGLLRTAIAAMERQGYTPLQTDLTIVAQRPKLVAYREAMRENLAAALGLDISRVSVKFKTTEGLGLTGRQEGIAAQAVAAVASSR